MVLAKASLDTLDALNATGRGKPAYQTLTQYRKFIATNIGLSADHLCRACLTGKYPTPTGERLYQLALRNRHAETNGRTYETPVEVSV